MKKEIIVWSLISILAIIGFLLFLNKLAPDTPTSAISFASPSSAAPAFFATIALASIFLVLRIFHHHNHSFHPTRFRHIAGATIISAGGVISWEFSQMFLMARPFSFYILPGCLGGSLTLVLLWGLLKLYPKKTPD